MKIAIISGSRADAGALWAISARLLKTEHVVSWQNDTKAMPDGTDLVLLHGDRFETLANAFSAYLMGLPIAHLGGGDVTEGSQDDSMRHAITKLSHLHFVTCAESAMRVVQLGEDPERVHNTGDPGIDTLLAGHIYPRDEALAAINMRHYKHFIVVGLHPHTMGRATEEIEAVCEAISMLTHTHPGVGVVLLDPNKDLGHLIIERRFTQLASEHKNVRYCERLDRPVFLGLLHHCRALVGNSSAGFYEAPTLNCPVVNVGNRQFGRLQSTCILNVPLDSDAIHHAIRLVLAEGRPTHLIVNPYGDGHAAARIVDILGELKDPKELLHKRFFDVKCEGICLTRFGRRSTQPESGESIPTSTWSDGLLATTTVHPTTVTSGFLI